MPTKCNCPTCGQSVEVLTGKEGTSCYIGKERDEALEEAARYIETKGRGHCVTDPACMDLAESLRALKTYASKSEMKRVVVLKSKKGGE